MGQTGIDQGSDEHIPADAGETIQVGDLHSDTRDANNVTLGAKCQIDKKTTPKGHHENTKGGKHERKILLGFFVLSNFRAFVIGFSSAFEFCHSCKVLFIN
jgi:hypothetical protein